MTYKETLFFIGKCLTITHEEHNRLEIEQELKDGEVDWDAVVKISTAQYVFPALYCNLKRANFLSYLPKELVNYMMHITDLNRDRNQQIKKQAKEINELLLANNITPIFLKGTGFLLQDFYEDIAERMVGDIDFLVADNEFKRTVKILKEDGYGNFTKHIYYPKFHRHYQTIVKKNKIAAVEIHKEILNRKYKKKYNYNLIKNKLKAIKNSTLLNNEQQFILTNLSIQINDNGYLKRTIAYRNLYDMLLLSYKIDTLQVLENTPHFFKHINTHLNLGFLLFNKPKSFKYIKNKRYLKKTLFLVEHPGYNKIALILIKKYLDISNAIDIFIKSFYKKKFRDYLLNRISNFKWIKERILGIKSKSSKK